MLVMAAFPFEDRSVPALSPAVALFLAARRSRTSAPSPRRRN